MISNRFAHNFFIHKGVELGLLGLLSSLGMFVALYVVGGYQLLRERKIYSVHQKLVLTGLLAILAGRLLEQMVGVAAVSGLTISWVLLGIFVALPAIMRVSQEAPDPKPSPQPSRKSLHHHTPTRLHSVHGGRIWRVAVVAVLIFGIGALTWSKSISYPWAGVKAREGLNQILEGDFPRALSSLDQAIDLAPDVSVYHLLKAATYSMYLINNLTPRDIDCGFFQNSGAYDACLARKAYLSNREAFEQRPFDWSSRLALAKSALTLAKIEGDSDLAAEAIQLHRQVAELDPHAWWRWESLAGAYLQVGQPEAVFPPLERSMAIVAGTALSANSLLLQGMAYKELAQPRKALEAFDAAVLLDYPNVKPSVYTDRGAVYNDLGQYHRAIQELNEAIILNPSLATAYINRGNAYGNLDQLHRAIEDFNEAVRLNPRYGLAYSNRALAYTYLGRDPEAQQDVERASELGADTASLLATIEQLRQGR